MTRLPKCYQCKKIKGISLKCSEYPNGIPKDIANQTIDCPKFVAAKGDKEEYSDDLPVINVK